MSSYKQFTAHLRNFRFTRWKWETMKMGIYVFVPIGIFVYFSNPARYEKALIEEYRKSYIPVSDDDLQLLQDVKEKVRRKQLEELRARVQKDIKIVMNASNSIDDYTGNKSVKKS